MQDFKHQLAREVAKECKTVDDVHSMLKELFKGTLQEILEAEMEEHLGYKKHSVVGNNTGNSPTPRMFAGLFIQPILLKHIIEN